MYMRSPCVKILLSKCSSISDGKVDAEELCFIRRRGRMTKKGLSFVSFCFTGKQARVRSRRWGHSVYDSKQRSLKFIIVPHCTKKSMVLCKCMKVGWTELRECVQQSADCANTRSLYEGMTKTFGPSTNKICTTQNIHWRNYHRVQLANGEVGWTLPVLGDTVIILSPFCLVIDNSTLL